MDMVTDVRFMVSLFSSITRLAPIAAAIRSISGSRAARGHLLWESAGRLMTES
jgi:hypothetical protein